MFKKLAQLLAKKGFQDAVIHLVLISISLFLVSSNVFLYSNLKKVTVTSEEKSSLEERPAFMACDSACRAEIAEIILLKNEKAEEPAASQTAAPLVSKEKEISYISLGGTATTTNTDWTDVAGSEAYIDLVNDYGAGAALSWEASLKVAHDNGVAYGRLFDSTHGIAVDGSELSVTDTDQLTFVTTKNLPIWSGRNLYKVQIKSLNSFLVTYGSGRVKIVH